MKDMQILSQLAVIKSDTKSKSCWSGDRRWSLWSSSRGLWLVMEKKMRIYHSEAALQGRIKTGVLFNCLSRCCCIGNRLDCIQFNSIDLSVCNPLTNIVLFTRTTTGTFQLFPQLHKHRTPTVYVDYVSCLVRTYWLLIQLVILHVINYILIHVLHYPFTDHFM